MTDHTQNAIEAIFETVPVGCTIRDAERIYLATLPHLREMITEEIRGDVKDFEPSCQEDIIWHDAHMNAARIAKGPQQ